MWRHERGRTPSNLIFRALFIPIFVVQNFVKPLQISLVMKGPIVIAVFLQFFQITDTFILEIFSQFDGITILIMIILYGCVKLFKNKVKLNGSIK